MAAIKQFDDNYHVYQPMKYYSTKKDEYIKDALEDPNYGLQRKVDGSSYVWAKDLDGSVHLYGDKYSKKTMDIIDKIDNVPHMKEFAELNFPRGTQFCVEVYSFYDWSSGRPEFKLHPTSKYVNSIMLAKPEKAISRQQTTQPIQVYVFDCLFINAQPVWEEDFIQRWHLTEAFFANCGHHLNGPLPAWLSLADLITEDKAMVLAKWLKDGEEGGVLKMLHSEEKLSAAHAVTEIGDTAKRPAHVTYKVKQMDTLDVVCLGVTYPNKEYKGKDPENYPYRDEEGNPVNRLWALNMINAFVVGAYDLDRDEYVAIGTIASGLDDELRKAAYDDPEGFVDKVFEVTCMSIDTKDHTLRHPRIVCERPDKVAKECTIKEIFG